MPRWFFYALPAGVLIVVLVSGGVAWYLRTALVQPRPSPLAEQIYEPAGALPVPSVIGPLPEVAGERLASRSSPSPSRLPSPIPSPSPAGPVLWVSPTGSDEGSRGSEAAPLRTIQYALQQAQPGTTIAVKAGTYTERLATVRNANAAAPITLKAQGRVVLAGTGSSGRVLEVKHDYHVITGFEFARADILLWLQEADYTTIRDNTFHDAQGECVRIKYHSSHNRFEQNRVERCGREDYGGGGDGKNGEGVYLGTAPEQLDKNPTGETDRTDHNVIRANVFNTQGNECVDIKEGSRHNIVEWNTCTGQRDPESGGLNSRGSNNIFRYNTSHNNTGAGIRFGGDGEADGTGNQAYGNTLRDNAREAIKVVRLPQGQICGNTVSNNQRGFSNQDSIRNDPCPFPLAKPSTP